jgi:hypothetical protein
MSNDTGRVLVNGKVTVMGVVVDREVNGVSTGTLGVSGPCMRQDWKDPIFQSRLCFIMLVRACPANKLQHQHFKLDRMRVPLMRLECGCNEYEWVNCKHDTFSGTN